MIFKTKHEAKNWFLKYKPLTEDVISFLSDYPNIKGFKQWEFGDWILFQHITNNIDPNSCATSKDLFISRPILAIFTNYKIWDQALVINFVQPARSWMSSHEVITNPDPGKLYSMRIVELDDEIEAIQFWTDNIKVLGHWKHKPSIAELKQSLK